MSLQEIIGGLRSLSDRGNHEARVITKVLDALMASQRRLYVAQGTSIANRSLLNGLSNTGLDLTPLEGEIILLKDQTVSSENGLYIASAGTWSRLLDDLGYNIVAPGLIVTVTKGAAFADTQWEVSSDGVNIGIDPITLKRLGGSAPPSISQQSLVSVSQIDNFIPTSGQTAFTLSHSHSGSVEMYINGIRQKINADFTVVGPLATWLNIGFQLAPTDDVAFVYLR
jgi:hypothetical protein